MTKPTVFVSYSHKDEIWKDKLRPQLGVLEKQECITIWDDRQIDPGGEWYEEIKEVMAQAAVSVCLISANYLSSDFCIKEEIPYLLERREKDGMVLIPVLIKPCTWKAVPWLKESQMIPRDGKSVSKHFKDDPDEVFAAVAEYIFNIFDNPEYIIPEPAPIWSSPEKININRLPMTGEELFGRKKQLEMLDKAWESDNTHIVSFVAWGGVGKTTLVNKWLERMASDNYRGAQRVFGWSFHSQGTGEKVTSADLFISEALEWFGDPDPKVGSLWDKGQRLAELIQENKTLLVLDGLEPLQSPYDYEQGKVRDPGMATILSEMARNNQGLCIITTREDVADLAQFPGTTCQENLEQISPEAGRAILRIAGVQGYDAELEAATCTFGYYALALTLLGVYIKKIPGHHISSASKIPDLDIPENKGRHPRRMMAVFEELYGKGPEVEVLSMLGLFTRPAEGGAIAALLAPPAITNLTECVQKLSEADWLRLLQTLRKDRLIASESRHEPDTLDCHPLLREHFGEKLKKNKPETWKEAHSRLYEYYRNQAKEYPSTIEEMVPLYQAVAHGCQACRYHEALIEVYYKRIHRGLENFHLAKLGAFGADLAMISGFYDKPWYQLSTWLTPEDRALILYMTGFDLKSLGRLKEATQHIQVSLKANEVLKDWRNSARAAYSLSELYLTIGDVDLALEYAKQSIYFAKKSRDSIMLTNSKAMMGDALHHAGKISKAERFFRDAEKIEKQYLYSKRGFQYCDLLLSQGKYQDVQRRTIQTIEIAKRNQWLLDIAHDYLSIGRSYFLLEQQLRSYNFTQALTYLNKAVDCLQEAKQQLFLPRGLLARAELYRVKGKFNKAKCDLEKAMTIAEHGEMGLHQADYHLEYCRLFLAMGEKDKAREHLATAKEMIGRMGYHRRDGEVEELEAML